VIAGLIGTIHRVEPDAVIVNVQGVLYRVLTTGRVVSRFNERGMDVELHTRQVVRDDAHLLFGFATLADLTWFDTLIGINGVGPKLALAILTRFAAEDVFKVIANEDIDQLVTVPGVGKRTASRILLDLRGKLPENFDAPLTHVSASNSDAIAALQALGYSLAESRKALDRIDIDESATVEDQIVAALRAMES